MSGSHRRSRIGFRRGGVAKVGPYWRMTYNYFVVACWHASKRHLTLRAGAPAETSIKRTA
ncbi:hypothetical protein DAPPUDRAFT_244124 [Daphnia pulex]|uniref:Uncharacterized protein n=1 Tax=Daphnia pulex TaxID=6669 RepID=E9GK94_DAPPU|nr:hypothetical protein DAPPUDRAFT_244124 [Daphnia pulex]|eukprot:EFX80098.1 hypothetical protein DAPPUDRAFT_244124 [Daphnia pulex]